jgi:hypothetical protein
MDLYGKARREEKPEGIAGDRREDRRYPIELEMKYKLIRRKRVLQTGTGFTIDLSSGGLLVETDTPLPVGLNVELSISWPVLLHDVAPMRLLVIGRVVRNHNNRSAVRSVQHEFRTQGVPANPEPATARRPADRPQWPGPHTAAHAWAVSAPAKA